MNVKVYVRGANTKYLFYEGYMSMNTIKHVQSDSSFIVEKVGEKV